MKEELENLILANHILHYHQVLDAYGHVSIRHPENPDVFVMSASLAPALVSSPSQLIHYSISDSSPIDPSSPKGYQERFIHSEIYKRYPAINSVIHSHADAVLPYTMNGVPLKPVFHIAGFLGTHVPTFDILPLYKKGESQDFLVNNTYFGSALASQFSSPPTQQQNHNVVLMTNHGYTVIGTSLKQAVYRAIYTRINASIQTQALTLRSAASGFVASKRPSSGSSSEGLGNDNDRSVNKNGWGEMRFLDTEEQVEGCMAMNDRSQERPWELWVREVRRCGLYEVEAEME